MAQSESGDRTEPATPRKRQEARERGQVAKSQDLTAALVLLAAVLALHLWGKEGLLRMGAMVKACFRDLSTGPMDAAEVVRVAGWCILLCGQALLPAVALVFAAALAANLLQVGFLVTGHPISPDLNRLNPVSGLQRIFSLRGLFRGGFGLLKVGVLGAVLCTSLWHELAGPQSPGAAALLGGGTARAAATILELAVELGLEAAAAILVLAIFDYAFQRLVHERDLRMSRSELREELRRMEGDPRIKERRRKVQERLRYQRMMRDVPRADVVVTNPTHLAVALRYDRREMGAPRVVAKGEGWIAQRIREVAMEHGIPVVERRELARALHGAVEIGAEIPPELYKAVAELLAYVYRMAGHRPRPAPEAASTAGPGRRQPVGAGREEGR